MWKTTVDEHAFKIEVVCKKKKKSLKFCVLRIYGRQKKFTLDECICLLGNINVNIS